MLGEHDHVPTLLTCGVLLDQIVHLVKEHSCFCVEGKRRVRISFFTLSIDKELLYGVYLRPDSLSALREVGVLIGQADFLHWSRPRDRYSDGSTNARRNPQYGGHTLVPGKDVPKCVYGFCLLDIINCMWKGGPEYIELHI